MFGGVLLPHPVHDEPGEAQCRRLRLRKGSRLFLRSIFLLPGRVRVLVGRWGVLGGVLLPPTVNHESRETVGGSQRLRHRRYMHVPRRDLLPCGIQRAEAVRRGDVFRRAGHGDRVLVGLPHCVLLCRRECNTNHLVRRTRMRAAVRRMSRTVKLARSPAGFYGETTNSPDSTCSGQCLVGYYCVAGSITATATICPAGAHSVLAHARCVVERSSVTWGTRQVSMASILAPRTQAATINAHRGTTAYRAASVLPRVPRGRSAL